MKLGNYLFVKNMQTLLPMIHRSLESGAPLRPRSGNDLKNLKTAWKNIYELLLVVYKKKTITGPI